MEEQIVDVSGKSLTQEQPELEPSQAPLEQVPNPYAVPEIANSLNIQSRQIIKNGQQLSEQLVRENSLFSEDVKAFKSTWETTYLATSIDYLKNDVAYMMDEEDKPFTDTLTTDFVDGWLMENGLPIKYRQRMQSAKNQDQWNAYAKETKVDVEKATNANAILNSYGGMLTARTMSGITTSVLGDVDSFVPLLGWAAKAKKINKIVAGLSSAGIHTGAVSIAYSKDPDVTAGEALVSGVLGSAFDGAGTLLIARQKGAKMLNDTPDNDTLNTNIKNHDAEIHERTVELSLIDKNQLNINELAKQANQKNKAGEFTAEADKARKQLDKAILEQRALKLNTTPDELKALDKLEETAKKVNKDGKPTKKASEAIEELNRVADEDDLNKAVLDDLTDAELAKRAELKSKANTKDKDGKTPDEAFDAQQELKIIEDADKAKVDAFRLAKQVEQAEIRKASKKKAASKRAQKSRERSHKEAIANRQAKEIANNKNRKNQTTEKKHKREIEEAEWEARFYKSESDDLLRIADEMKSTFDEISARLKKGTQVEEDLQLLKDIRLHLEKLNEKGIVNDKWFNEFITAIDSAEGYKKFKITFKKDSSGKYYVDGLGGKKLLLPATILLTGTGAFASDDSTITTTSTLGMALAFAVLFGLSGGRVQGMFSELKSVGKRITNKNQTSTYMEKVDELTETARFSFMETYTQIFSDGGAKMQEFADMTLWNAIDGSANSMDTIKKILVQEWNQNLLAQMDLGYKKWMKEQGIGATDRMGNMFQASIGYRQRFERELFEAIENGTSTSNSMMETAREVNKIKRKAYDEMVASGVNGIENVKFDDTYMPRSLRTGYIGTVLRGANQESIDRFTDMIAGMMTGADRLVVSAKAKAYVSGMMKIGESRDAFNTLEGLRQFMLDSKIVGVTAEEMADFMGIGTRLQRDTIEVGEQFSRTKKRIELDKSKWQDIAIYSTTGEQTDIIIDSVFKSQVTEVMSTYFNQVAGQVAIASKGKTVPEMYAYAKTSIRNGKVVEEIVDDLLGMPILDESSMATKLMRDLSNYNVASTMGMSVLSLMQESVLIVSNMNKSGFKTSMSEFKNIFIKHGKSSELVQSFKDYMGVGMHKQSASYGTFNHMAEANLMDGTYRTSATGQFVTKVGETARDITLYNLGMVPVSDYFSLVASSQNLQSLGEFVVKGKQFSSARMKAYGLNASNTAIVKKYVSLTPDGYAKQIDWDNIPAADRIALKSVLFNMNQKQIMQVTNGNTGHWTTANPIGIALSQLLKFPMGAYSNHGLFRANSMARGDDLRTYAETLGWFMSGYLVSVARAELKGQDKTDEEHLVTAMMSMNILGVVNVARGLSDPAIFSTAENMKRLQNIVN